MNAVEIADTDDFYGRASLFPALQVAFGRWWLVFPLGVYGLVALWRQRARLLLGYWGAVAYTLSLLVFFVLGRYRFPLVVLLAPFAAFSLARLPKVRLFLGQRLPLAAALFAGAVSLLPVVSRDEQRACSEITLGDYYLTRQQDPASALFHYETASRLAPGSAEALLRRAGVLAQLGRHQEAEGFFGRAAALAPGWPEVFFQWGSASLSQGRPDDAARHLFRAVELGDDRALTLRLLGDALFGLNQVDAAIELYRKALERSPEDPIATNNLGAAYARLRRWSEAEFFFGRATELDPAYLQPWINLGKLYLSQGRVEEARQVLARALRLEPTDSQVRALLERLPPPK